MGPETKSAKGSSTQGLSTQGLSTESRQMAAGDTQITIAGNLVDDAELRVTPSGQPAAENVAESLTRGMRVLVSGRLRQRSYETKEGEKRTVYEVEVDDVGPSLRNASAKVNRVARSGAGDGGYGGGQRSSGGRPSGGGQGGGYGGGSGGGGGGGGGGGEPDPWASDSPGGYSDEPPF